MGLFKDDGSKTEAPTPRRLQEAADKGQVAQSRDLTAAMLVLAVAIAVAQTGPGLLRAMSAEIASGLDVGRVRSMSFEDTIDSVEFLRATVTGVFPAALGFVGIVVAAAFAASALQVGVRIRPKALRWDWSRLSPMKNFQKLFRPAAILRAVIALAQIGATAWILHTLIGDELTALSLSGQLPLTGGISILTDLVTTALGAIGLMALFIGLVDFGWQRFDMGKQLRMTRREVEDERKRSEGDPLIRSRIRRAAQELAQRRMMEAIPEADVVITNPTHFAVALRYRRGEQAAPEVVAKGADEVAARIRALATEHDVPIQEDPPLARALFRTVKIGEQIPEHLYKAVASVLSHVLDTSVPAGAER